MKSLYWNLKVHKPITEANSSLNIIDCLVRTCESHDHVMTNSTHNCHHPDHVDIQTWGYLNCQYQPMRAQVLFQLTNHRLGNQQLRLRPINLMIRGKMRNCPTAELEAEIALNTNNWPLFQSNLEKKSQKLTLKKAYSCSLILYFLPWSYIKDLKDLVKTPWSLL